MMSSGTVGPVALCIAYRACFTEVDVPIYNVLLPPGVTTDAPADTHQPALTAALRLPTSWLPI